jgi:hypothetical protein
VDIETRDWPIPSYCQSDFDDIKRTHRVQPLLVYKDGVFVEPVQTSASLAGSLAEFHFTIRHYNISKGASAAFDSFTANIEEVHILKLGTPKSKKRKNPREGPARKKVGPGDGRSTVDSQKQVDASQSDLQPKPKNMRMTARMSTGGAQPSVGVNA